MLTFVLVVLALTALVTWALVTGLGNPPRESAWDALARMGIEVHASPFVPEGQAYIFDRSLLDSNYRAFLMEERIAMAVVNPKAFVITNIGP